ncbi:MAG: DUF58 domain-containing protein [Lachnospiraceae bacterium]|nr:DUF58 domain-containing protein [Lachnospiraceae bacterium]
MLNFIYILVTLVTWYYAGLYYSPVLMAVAVSEVLFYVVMLFQVIYLRGKMEAVFRDHAVVCRIFSDERVRVRVSSKAGIPVPRYALNMRFSFMKGANESKTYVGGLEDNEEREVSLSVTPVHLGVMTVALKPVKVYDYLSLFSMRHGRKTDMRIYVLPARRIPEHSMISWHEDPVNQSESHPDRGEEPPEITDIREYREDDPVRRIDWKLRVGSDDLYVREYEKPSYRSMAFYADRRGAFPDIRWRDAYYDLIYTMITGLVDEYDYVKLSFTGASEEIKAFSPDDCDSFMLALYSADADDDAESREAVGVPPEGCAVFGRDLKLMIDGNLIRVYSKEDMK